jgi:hypothetical protein
MPKDDRLLELWGRNLNCRIPGIIVARRMFDCKEILRFLFESVGVDV